jgi:hypothetical protein
MSDLIVVGTQVVTSLYVVTVVYPVSCLVFTHVEQDVVGFVVVEVVDFLVVVVVAP